LIRLWLGHGGSSVTDLYVNIEEDTVWGKEEAERANIGSTLPTSVVPNVLKLYRELHDKQNVNKRARQKWNASVWRPSSDIRGQLPVSWQFGPIHNS
jgi:hypothetical protein